MPRRKVREGDVHELLAELEAEGARNIVVRPAGVEGWCTVQWDREDAPNVSEEHAGDVLRHRAMVALLALTPVLLWILVTLVGGILDVLIGYVQGGTRASP